MALKDWCSVCPGVGKGILKFITDLRFFFHKDFIRENYYLHFSFP